ncbi:MAG: alpha/beta hydrolase [Pseudomonadota bacterium]
MRRLLKIFGVLFGLLAIAFVVFRTPDTDAAEMRVKYAGEPSRFVELGDGTTVHLRDEGPRDGTPIILLHGSNADLHTWEPWAKQLRETYRVIRFDQVGHGLTGPAPDGDYSTDAFVADIREVADALDLQSFILGGNSMGGSHTVAYAMKHSDRLDGIVLVDAGGADIRKEGGGNIGFSIARTPVINLLMEHITPRSLVKQSLEQSVSNQAIVTEAAVDRYWEMLRYPGNRRATIARFSRGWAGFDAQSVSAIDVPALIIWGTEDSLIPVEAGRWYDQQIPNSTLVEYPGIGHLPHEEAPSATIADLSEWLTGLVPDQQAP